MPQMVVKQERFTGHDGQVNTVGKGRFFFDPISLQCPAEGTREPGEMATRNNFQTASFSGRVVKRGPNL